VVESILAGNAIKLEIKQVIDPVVTNGAIPNPDLGI
jgi:hypothetical protein